MISNITAITYVTIKTLWLRLEFYPEKFLPLEVLNLLQADPHSGDVVVPAGAVRVPDGHHQAHLVQLRQRHLDERGGWVFNHCHLPDLVFKLGLKGRIQSFIESCCLLVSILEVSRPIVGQEVDQSVGILAPLTVQVLPIIQRNVNIVSSGLWSPQTLAESR